MKRILFVAALVVNGTIALMAQSSIRINVGYALPLGRQMIGEARNETSASSGSVKAVYASYGSGFPFQVGYSRNFKNSSLGFDIEAGYIFGKKQKFTSHYEDGSSATQRSYARAFQIAPSLTFTEKVGKVALYSRVGPVVSFTKMHFHITGFDGTWTTLIGYEANGGFDIGFKGALGVTINPEEKVQFFSELNFTALSCAPKEGKLDELNIGGANVLPDLSAEERKISFEEDYQYSDSDASIVDTRSKYAMSSLAIQVGIRFVL